MIADVSAKSIHIVLADGIFKKLLHAIPIFSDCVMKIPRKNLRMMDKLLLKIIQRVVQDSFCFFVDIFDSTGIDTEVRMCTIPDMYELPFHDPLRNSITRIDILYDRTRRQILLQDSIGTDKI